MTTAATKPKAAPASNLATTKPTVLQLAALFGIGKGATENWTKSGKLAATGSTLAEHIAAFTVHKNGTGNGSGDLTREKIREAKARADKYEIQNARLLCELVPLVDVESAIKAALMDARSNLLNLPNDIG